MDLLERGYDYFLRATLGILNPIKKSVITTECKVHKFINVMALDILKNDGFHEEYPFFTHYITPLNDGAVWADQDFKSTGHFYHPHKKRGLYGRKNAMDLGVAYYQKAVELWRIGEFDNSLFYLGASLHIIQDMTIHQHANIRLLDNHRQFETFVKRTYQYVEAFRAEEGAYLLDSIESYIRFNTRVAMKVYKRFKMIKDNEKRYYRIARCALPLAKRTTAGAMVLFYRQIFPSTPPIKRRPLLP